MAGVTGRQADIAFAKFATNSWGVAASVTKGIYFSSDGGLKFSPSIVVDDAFGQVFTEQAEVGNVPPVSPNFGGVDRFDDYNYVWEALAMGSPATVTISTSAGGQTTSWQHIIDLAPNTDGLGLTAAIDKVAYVDELTSAKVTGWREELGDGGMMRQTYKTIGTYPTNISSTNTRSTVAGATYPALGNRIFAKGGTFRMNLNTAGALGAGDVVKIESVAFEWDRPQDAPNVFGQNFVDEPADNGFPTFRVEVSYPRLTANLANSLHAGLRAGTAFKADLTFLGNFINSTDQYKKLYQWPYLQLAQDGFEAPLVGANQVKPKAIFEARIAQTSPTGMAFINPFRLTRTMVNSVHAFS